MGKLYELVKRSMDLAAAGVGLAALAPLLGAIAVAVKADSPGPVLFRQRRLGRNGEIFELLKFRTMKHGASVIIGGDHTVVNPVNDDRVTRVGAMLRKASLDELPQLINVLFGQMTLVGPRPDLPEGLQVYDSHQRRKLEVKPGITGLAQISGRNLLSAEEKWEFDVKYVDSRSLLTDALILLRTFGKVFSAAGIYKTENKATADRGKP
ncbi:MAG TPA: sugar transferase [Myxococcota bacterium]|nr:sugar transferase [Myxococcota bacterium]HRY93146.1 sugar transferase [Myxococcota bacterium]